MLPKLYSEERFFLCQKCAKSIAVSKLNLIYTGSQVLASTTEEKKKKEMAPLLGESVTVVINSVGVLESNKCSELITKKREGDFPKKANADFFF